jgi:hypothetical protein
MFRVLFDFLPQEGDKAEFYQEWFFAKPYEHPYYLEKVRIVTESLPVQYQY